MILNDLSMCQQMAIIIRHAHLHIRAYTNLPSTLTKNAAHLSKGAQGQQKHKAFLMEHIYAESIPDV